jgi:hypothetical protein
VASTLSPTASLNLALPKTSRREFLWQVSLGLLAATLLSFALLQTQPDNDLWGHLRVGLDTLQSHTATRTDEYAYTHSGALTINHEWLGEAVQALAWRAAGATGLVSLKICLALMTGLLCFYHLLRAGVSSGGAAVVLLMLIGLVPPFLMVRPLLFSIPVFALTLIVIYKAEHDGTKMLWILPPVYALAANLHGGFLAGLGILCIWGVFHVVFRHRQVLAIGLPVAAAFAATCLNPYGWRLLAFLIRTTSVPRPEIVEWNPLPVTSPYGVMYVAILGVVVAGLVMSRLEKRWPLIALFGVTSLLPFVATRHTPLAVLAAVILAGPHAGDALKQLARTSRARSVEFPSWALILPLACTAVLVLAAARRPVSINVPADRYPVQAVKLLAASGIEGNLVNQFNWGEYILWHLGPRVQVMIDGRREWVYSDDTYQKYLRFQDGSGEWDRLLRDYRADVALLEKESTSANLMQLKSEWKQVYADGVAVILVRDGTLAAAQVTKAAAAFSPTSGPFYFP